MLRQNFTRNSSNTVKVSIPELQESLFLKPSLADKQTIHHARFMLLSSSYFRRLYHCSCNYRAMSLCNFPFFELARHDPLNKVLQA